MGVLVAEFLQEHPGHSGFQDKADRPILTTNEHRDPRADRQHARLAVDVSTLADDASLYEAGMTSHATVNLMLALENAFDVEFPDSMLRRSVFESVTAIAAALSELQQAA